MGSAASTASLIEQDDAIASGIKESPMPWGTPRAWSTMKDNGRLPESVSADLPIDKLTARDGQHAVFSWLNRRV
jgi:hypothetical protein